MTAFATYARLPEKGGERKVMSTINHYSLLTGNLRESTADEVKPVIYFRLKSVINRARKGKTELIDNTYIEIVEEEGVYICTLYGKKGSDYVPIVTTGGTKDERQRKYLWDSMENMTIQEYGDKYIRKVPIACPYILDLVHTSAVFFVDKLTWTGDFTKCLGWMMLFPDEVRPK